MFGSEQRSSKHGAKAAIVPGALAGYQELHKSFGKFEWKEVFAPAIRLARNGFHIGPHLARALYDGAQGIEAASALKSRFWSKDTNSLLRKGEKLVQPDLANVLEKISQQGVDYFYKGELAKEIASAVGAAGGVINSTDLAEYRASWVDAIGVKTKSGRYLYSAPIPGCGVILAAAVHNVALKRIFNEEPDGQSIPRMSKETIHSFIERLKLALSRRPDLGDQTDTLQKQESIMYAIMADDSKLNGTVPMAQAFDYGLRHAPEEDFGGAHLSILAPNGDALSVTSSLNSAFGSMFVTPSGLLLNNYMDAFAKPGRRFDLDASPANLLGPRKRPMTSMAPTIITEGKAPSNIFGIFGAGGGLEGLSALAQLITCLRAYPLWRCVRDDIRMQPTFRETVSGLVYVDGKNAAYDPAALLRKIGHKVVLRTLKSTASGIISTSNLSWYATGDSVHSDGGSAGR
ncbi:glutathione hydrolase 1 proenzyme-like [Amblyomma americanum]